MLLKKVGKHAENYKGLIYFILVFIFQVMTNICFKMAAQSIGEYRLRNILINEFYLLSILLLALRLFFWQLILSTCDLSVAYSIRSLGYVFLLMVSGYYFKESISVYNIIGAGVIVLGVLIISQDLSSKAEKYD